MLPYKTILSLDRDSEVPLYLQIAEQISKMMQEGILQKGSKLPASRVLANDLEVNRQTVVIAYEELEAQGWISIRPRVGAVVIERIVDIPKITTALNHNYPTETNFEIEDFTIFTTPILYPVNYKLSINDGFPDVRLAPMEALMRAYRNVSKRSFSFKHLMYHIAEGSLNLRNEIANDLFNTRGLKVSAENLMITRGSQMGIFLTASVILNKGDAVIVGERNYFAANATFRKLGAEIIFVPVDFEGIVVDAIETICKKQKVKMIYITPHHYHPTTVTLSATRRNKLLELASEFNFAILEDDYDYDFHYSGAPILPIASADVKGNVIYVGSLCKTIAPAIRTGFMVAPNSFIKAAAQLRRILDRQGDTILEESIAEIYRDGTVSRHMKKALKMYKERRDYLALKLKEKFPEEISFKVPEGGMAIWAKFNCKQNLIQVSEKAAHKGLYISNGSVYKTHDHHENETRLGFASLNFEEIDKATSILEQVIKGH